MSGNGVTTSDFGELSPELASILQQSPQTTPSGGDPFGDLPMVPSAPRVRSARSEVRAFERESDRVAATRISPALKRFGEIARIVPGAERVRVRKRLSTGQIGPIGEWSLRDIQTSGDLESFLMQYVRPKWRGGEYFLAVIDGNGREHDAGQIPLPEPPTELMGGGSPAGDGALDLVRDLVNRMERQQHQAPAAVDPFEQIKKAKQLMSELGGGNGNNSDSMAALLLAMQQQQNQRPAGPDPVMVQLLERLASKVEKLEQGGGMAALPPPPPPPPSFDMSALTNLLGTVALPLVMKLLDKNDDRDRLSARDLIEIMDRRNSGKGDDDRFTARDAISLMREIQSGTQQQSLRDKLEEMNAIRELAFNITGGGGAGQNTTFWDALAAFASNKGLADGLGRILGGEIQKRQQPQPLPPGSVQTLPPRTRDPRLAAPPVAPPSAPTQPEEPRVMLPDDFGDYMKKLVEAQNDEARIMAVIETLNHLRSMPQWSGFVQAMLGGAAQNEREKVLRGLSRWLGMLVNNNLLPDKVAEATIESFTKEWEAIHATIAKLVGAEVQKIEEAKAAEGSTSPSTSPSASTSPSTSPDDDDDDDEDDEDDNQ